MMFGKLVFLWHVRCLEGWFVSGTYGVFRVGMYLVRRVGTYPYLAHMVFGGLVCIWYVWCLEGRDLVCIVWVVGIGGHDGELRPWHCIYLYSIERRLKMRVMVFGGLGRAIPWSKIMFSAVKTLDFEGSKYLFFGDIGRKAVDIHEGVHLGLCPLEANPHFWGLNLDL